MDGIDNELLLYELTSGSFPVLHYQQSRLAEVYRRWDVIQHVNNELLFPQPTNVVENPRVIVACHKKFLLDIDSLLKQTYSVINVTDYKPEKAHSARSYKKDVIQLPWKIRFTDSNISQPCQGIIVVLTYNHESGNVDGLEQFKLVQKVINRPKELAVILENFDENQSDIDTIKFRIVTYLKEHLPGWLTYQETQQLVLRICFNITEDLNALIQKCIVSSLFRYSTMFHDHCLQAFQMFDVLVENEEENLKKRKECSHKYLQRYKGIISENREEMERKVKEALENESEDILLEERQSSKMVYLKNKSDKEYTSTLWDRLLEKLSKWIFRILQAFVQEISLGFAQNTGIGYDIYSICVEQLTISSDKTVNYSASFLQSLRDILKSIWEYVFGIKEDTDKAFIHNACLKLKDNSEKASQEIVDKYIEHYLESIEQSEIEDNGKIRLLRILKDDSYKIKLQVNSIIRDITEQIRRQEQQARKSIGQRLRTQVETEEVKNLLIRTKGVKSFRVHYDKLQIFVDSKTSFMEEFETSLKTELMKHDVYDIDITECGKEPTWIPASLVSSGDKISVFDDHFGTVGSLVKTHDGKLAFISAAHVLGEGNFAMVQKCESDNPVYVGKCIWSQHVNVPFYDLLDLSLVQLKDNVENQIENLGKHQHIDGRWFRYIMYEGEFEDILGNKVYKIGACTGYTNGIIASNEFFPDPKNEKVIIGEAWIVEPLEESEPFMKEGDSGSMVYIFKRPNDPPIQFISMAQAQGRDTEAKKSLTSALKHSIDRYESSTQKTIQVNFSES